MTATDDACADVLLPPTGVLDSLYLGWPVGPIVGVALSATAISAFFVLRNKGVARRRALLVCLACYLAADLAIYGYASHLRDERRQKAYEEMFREHDQRQPGAPNPAPEHGLLRIRAITTSPHIEVIVALPAGARAELPAGRLPAEQGERWLRLTLLDPATGTEGPAMLGSYERRDRDLVFTPRFALTPEQRYRATLEVPGSQPLTTEYRVPARAAAPPPVVEEVFPTAAVLPANQLKFYIHFSTPMREGGELFDRIQLLDAAGKEVAEPWRRTELWSADGRRLTLWVHPGRIKQGVNLRAQEGPVLEANQEYTLVVGADLLDAEGRRLAKAFTRKFRTGPEEHRRPLVDDWQLTPPPAGSRAPLVVRFLRSLDRALLDRFLTVVDADGQSVAGRLEVGREERSWSFHPEQPWRAAEYQLKVDGQLEDLAGNMLLRPFDVDLEAPAPAAPRLSLPFRPR